MESSLGTVRPDAAGNARLVVEGAELARLPDAVQVTREPAGGSAAPSARVVIAWPES